MKKLFNIMFGIIIVLLMSMVYFSNSQLMDIYSYRDKFVQDAKYIPREMTNPNWLGDFNIIYADFIWFESLQYYGDRKEKKASLEYLSNIFNSITNLDPYFEQAYSFGATLVGTDGHNWKGCEQLLKKGMINLPDDWRMPFFLGFFNYMWYKNYRAAELWFKIAVKKPGCPERIYHFIPFMHFRMGDYYTGMLMWIEIYNNAKNEQEKKGALQNIKVYAKKHLTKAIRSFIRDKGHVPENLYVLVKSGYAKGIPNLPDGSKFYYNVVKDSVLIHK